MKRKLILAACLSLGLLTVSSRPVQAQFSGRGLGMQEGPRQSSQPKYPSPNFPRYPTPNPYRPGPNEGHRPPGNPSYNIGVDIGRIIAPLLTPPRNPNPGPPPYRPPYQPQPGPTYYNTTPQQPVYNNPVVNTMPSNPLPSNTLPSNPLPDNELPEEEEETPEVPTEQNFALTGIEPLPDDALNLTQEQADAASESLQAQAEEKFQVIDKHIDGLKDAMEAQKQLADANLDPADAAKVKAAIDAKDPEALREALANAKGGVPGAEYADMIAAKMDMLNQAENLKDMVQNGASAVDIAQASQEYLKSAQQTLVTASVFDPSITAAVAQANLEQDFKNLNDIVALKAADEAIQSSVQGTLNVPGGTMPIPTDNLIATWVPWLDPGMTYSVGPQMVFLGSGEGGVLTSGFVTPVEAGLPVVTGQQVENSSEEDLETTIVVTNPDGNDKSVSFQLNGENYTLEPGYEQTMTGDGWTIKFNRGRGAGVAEYSLSNGNYEFSVGNQGWDLAKLEHEFTFDNTANAYDFNFVLDGEQLKVGARESMTWTTTSLLRIRFDNGHGQEKVKRLEDGTYSIGLDTQNNEIDLFEGDAQPTENSELFADNSNDGLWDMVTEGTQPKTETHQKSGKYPSPDQNSDALRNSDIPVAKVVQPPQRLLTKSSGRTTSGTKSQVRPSGKAPRKAPVSETIFTLE